MDFLLTDLKSVSSTCAKRACCGRFLSVSEVREPCIIKVTGFPSTISVEIIRQYFQNASHVQRIVNDIVMVPDAETCFVEFRNSSGMSFFKKISTAFLITKQLKKRLGLLINALGL